MAPRKAKQTTKPTTVEETPVVFFLRVSTVDIENVAPAESGSGYSEFEVPAVVSYSSILNSVDTFHKNTRFNTDLLKSVLDKVIIQSYSPQTACFWCCHGFVWNPVVLPISYDAYKNRYIAEGHFCSPECALAYNYGDGKISDSFKWNRHSLLGYLYADILKNRTLSPAPPRTLLRMFGGPLDIEQYRDYTSGDNNIVLSDLPPVRLQFPTMSVQGPLRDIKKYVSLSTDVVEKATEQLRLRRSKPANQNTPTLDMCLRKD